MTAVAKAGYDATMTRWPGGVLVAVIGLTMGCASPTPATQPDQAMPDLGTDAPDLEVEPDPGPGVDLATGDLAVAGGGDLAGGDLAMPPTCTPGAACTTSSPGACAPGHVVCTSGVAGCMADAQPAARENCFNDADDDCDGKVNNGCPDQLVVGATRALTAHGGTGGSPKSALCPAGTWLLKTSMYWDDKDKFVGGLDVWCAAPALVRGASSYSVA